MKTYEYTLVTRHSELDSSLHINNANYLRYLEEARVSMMFEQNFPMETVHNANVEMIIYKYVCNYKHQIWYPEKLTVRSKQIQTKKVRGVLRQEIHREDGSLCFQGDAYWAYHTKEKSQIDKTIEFTKKFGQFQHHDIPLLNAKKESMVNDSLPHGIVKIEVRPYEIDSFQHVNNAVYANYFEIGRWDFRKLLFTDINFFKKLELVFVIYKSMIQFQRPSFLFEELCIKTWLVELTPYRIIYWQEIQDSNGVVRASSRSEGCVVNKKGYPTKVSPEILLAYKQLLVIK
ncbi:MAG: acyl-CoA thioesterase [Leptospiraceae bacterium]|nr:acyl-CoA thioesterase [Leptospiraceae bacterium]